MWGSVSLHEACPIWGRAEEECKAAMKLNLFWLSISDVLLRTKIFLREECLELHPGMVGTKLQNPF